MSAHNGYYSPGPDKVQTLYNPPTGYGGLNNQLQFRTAWAGPKTVSLQARYVNSSTEPGDAVGGPYRLGGCPRINTTNVTIYSKVFTHGSVIDPA